MLYAQYFACDVKLIGIDGSEHLPADDLKRKETEIEERVGE